MEEQDKSYEESKKDISDLWLQDIYKALKNIEMDEKILRTGTTDIAQFVEIISISNNPGGVEGQTIIRTANMLIQDFEILLNNISPILKPEIMEMFRKLLKEIDDMLIDRNELYRERFQPARSGRVGRGSFIGIIRKEKFYSLIQKVSYLRCEIVKQLAHILFVQDFKQENKKRT